MYIGRNGPDSVTSIWSEGISIEVRIFRLITWITLYLVLTLEGIIHPKGLLKLDE